MTRDQLFGAKLKELRKAKGFSQTALGHAAGVSYAQEQKHESGVNRISCSALVLYAKALGVHPAVFFDEERRSLTGDYMLGVSDGRAEGLAEGMSRALARLRPVILDIERIAHEITPDTPSGNVTPLRK